MHTGIRDQRGLFSTGLPLSFVTRSPEAPASFHASSDEIALGRALSSRIGDATRMAAEAAAAAGLLELASPRFARAIHDVHTLATRVIARFLITGQGTTDRERGFIGGFGVLAALHDLPVATLAWSHLLWRDTYLRVLDEEAERLGTAPAVSEGVRKIIRSSADTAMVGMALAYDDQVVRANEHAGPAGPYVDQAHHGQ